MSQTACVDVHPLVTGDEGGGGGGCSTVCMEENSA